MRITIEGEPKEIADLALTLQNRFFSKDNKSFKCSSFCSEKKATKSYGLGFYAREFIDMYTGLEDNRKGFVESFIYDVINVALKDNILATDTKISHSLNITEKTKSEELAYLIARLPEQEQAKIYYMLKGFEIFGRTVSEAKH